MGHMAVPLVPLAAAVAPAAAAAAPVMVPAAREVAVVGIKNGPSLAKWFVIILLVLTGIGIVYYFLVIRKFLNAASPVTDVVSGLPTKGLIPGIDLLSLNPMIWLITKVVGGKDG